MKSMGDESPSQNQPTHENVPSQSPFVDITSPTQHIASMTFDEETSSNLMTPSRPSSHLGQPVRVDAKPKHLPFWIHFLAGGMAGTIGAVSTCPLELVKTRLQSSQYKAATVELPFFKHPVKATFLHIKGVIDALKTIYKTEGVLALWKGVGATVVGVMPARAIYFACYNKGKQFYTEINHGKETSMVHISSAVTAGVVTATATNPIWLVKTRIQLQSAAPELAIANGIPYYRSSWDCLTRVIRDEGVRALYQGLSASYLGVVESTLQWVIYERMKASLSEYKKSKNQLMEKKSAKDWLDYFLIAAASKWIACVTTYPHEVLRTRLRQAKSSGSVHYLGLRDAVRQIYRNEGLIAFYGGMTAHLMRVVPNSAIMFFCYEVFVYMFTNSPMHQNGQFNHE